MSIVAYLLGKLITKDVRISATLTRPNDTTAYAQADAVANATSGASLLTIPNVAKRKGGSFVLNRLAMIDSAAQTVKPDFDIWLFDSTSITIPNDNAAWSPSDADLKDHFVAHYGVFGSPHFLTGQNSANGVVELKQLGDYLKCADGDTNLYAVVRVGGLNGYTPIANEQFTFVLWGDQLP